MKQKKQPGATATWIASFILAVAVVQIPSAFPAESKPPPAFDENMTGYAKTEPSGVVAHLQRRIHDGKAKLVFEPAHGYLESLLKEFKLAPATQLLVASKTSPNKDLISPKNPRALYFNESVYIAYVPGASLLEVAAA